jgi:SAM-dependent methyltransferase
MTSKFEAPTFEALAAEQEIVQTDKFQGRLLKEYGRYIFPGQSWREPRSSAVTDFVRPICVGERVSLDGVIQGMCEASGDNPVRWVDMGGGRGLPMRQIASDEKRCDRLIMTNVDLFDFGLEGLEPDEITYLEGLAPGVTNDATAPHFIQANVETVTLPEPADLITSIEAIQYLNDPLAAIGNWYNQLADNGLLIISAEHDWAGRIRYQRESGQGGHDETSTRHLLEALEVSGVSFAASYESDWESGSRPVLDPNSFRNLVIQKAPGTHLVINSPVTEVQVGFNDFKVAYYEGPRPGSSSIVEVIAAHL